MHLKCLVSSLLVAAAASAQSLTGFWRDAESQGTYQIRQDEENVWWYGRSDDCGQSWQNVFTGTITDRGIAGIWGDLPPGKMQQSGTLTGEIDGRTLWLTATGGFG